MAVIERQHVRDRVYGLLLDRILDGRLAGGASVGEVALAQEFGISRTPLREALLALEREGFVDSFHGRGFVVRALSRQDAEEVYPMIAALERLALSWSPPFDAARLGALRAANRALGTARSARGRTRHDAAWHDLLVEGCSNSRLRRQLEGLRVEVQRYELAYMRDDPAVSSSVREHDQVLARLTRRDHDGAGALIEAQWQRGMRAVLDRLSRLVATDATPAS